MGCDGGTIPRRDELVRTKKKPEQVILSKSKSSIPINKFLKPFRKTKTLNEYFAGNIAPSPNKNSSSQLSWMGSVVSTPNKMSLNVC